MLHSAFEGQRVSHFGRVGQKCGTARDGAQSG